MNQPAGGRARQILTHAIQNENFAHDFYLDLARKSRTSNVKRLFSKLAGEESGHAAKLRAVLDGKIKLEPRPSALKGIKLSPHAEPADPGMDLLAAMRLAIRREESSQRLYAHLAEVAETQEAKDLFALLAGEEASHKDRLEHQLDILSILKD